jgi:hypothetical protein
MTDHCRHEWAIEDIQTAPQGQVVMTFTCEKCKAGGTVCEDCDGTGSLIASGGECFNCHGSGIDDSQD